MTARLRSMPVVYHELIGKTDLARVDAHVIQQSEYDEIPELTDEMVDRSWPGSDPIVLHRGRPKLARPKRQVTMRLDADLLDGLRATGPGWQGRVNAALRDWLRTRETV